MNRCGVVRPISRGRSCGRTATTVRRGIGVVQYALLLCMGRIRCILVVVVVVTVTIIPR